ncbi:MAG: TlyA family rRNA (cytidine-2'-O)-methyltransferase [Candidatus Acidiferrum sp.]
MKSKTRRVRLDALLVSRGHAESARKAQSMILAGEVFVNGQRARSAGNAVPEDSSIELQSRAQKYVSRGGVKLEGALHDFSIDPANRICLDIGSSTGGFTDCLLQQNAAKVYAVDVNIDQLDWKFRSDSRVIPVKRNARELSRADVPEDAELVVVDVSFISAGKVLRPAAVLAQPSANFLILVKPQFELPRQEIGVGGIVEDPALHEKAIAIVRRSAALAELEPVGVHPSRLPGAEGNQEYFLHARKKH